MVLDLSVADPKHFLHDLSEVFIVPTGFEYEFVQKYFDLSGIVLAFWVILKETACLHHHIELGIGGPVHHWDSFPIFLTDESFFLLRILYHHKIKRFRSFSFEVQQKTLLVLLP